MMKNKSSNGGGSSEESGNNNGDNDEEIEIMMQHFMVSWLSENNLEDDASKQDLGVSICMKEDDDCPHPRHLCFKHPFATTSYKRYCKKCYCYVCEEVAPCKKWNKPPNKHSQATPLKSWISSEKKKKAINNNTTTMARHTLSVCFMHHPDQILVTNGSGGGLITDSAGNWVVGFSMRVNSHLGHLDRSVPPYMALIEGLQLAWTRGFRYLDVKLGSLYHKGFWGDFKKDGLTGKYKLRLDEVEPASRPPPRAWGILKKVEGLFNQDWFLNVQNCVSIKEESGALGLTMMTHWVTMMTVYDFPSHPLTSRIKEMAESSKKVMGPLFEADLPGDPFKELKDYFRLN